MAEKKYRSYASLSPADKKKEDDANEAEMNPRAAALSKNKPAASKSPDYAQRMKDAQKKGDKKAYYTAQRERAAKTGDTKTLDRIVSKTRTADRSNSEKAVNYGRPDFANSPVGKAMSGGKSSTAAARMRAAGQKAATGSSPSSPRAAALAKAKKKKAQEVAKR